MKFLITVLVLTAAAVLVVAADEDKSHACPLPATYFPTIRTEAKCDTDNTCATGELCCSWFGSKHCLKGIKMEPKSGRCPVGTVDPFTPCIMDYVGCRFDAECGGDMKCCREPNCGYSQCQAPAEPRPCTRKGCRDTAGPDCRNVELIQPNGPECGPICRVCKDKEVPPTTSSILIAPPAPPKPSPPSPPPAPPAPPMPTSLVPPPAPVADDLRESLGCPSNPFWFRYTDTTAAACTTDSDCAPDEKCCYYGDDMRCKSGLVTVPKPGKCPRNALLLSKMLSCKYDYVGCKFDSQCEGSEKCCQNGCGYRECQAPKTRVRTTSSPQICTLLSCGPAPGPECRSKKLVRPNGPGCGPQCAVCEDDPVEPPRACTRMGCKGPQAGPYCKNVEEIRPNGPGCEPVCRICKDKPTTPAAPLDQPISCTEIGCYGKQAGPDCKNVFEYRPDGWGCFPLCRICLDRAKSPTRPRVITSAVRLVEESTVTVQTATDISTNASLETSTHQMSTETSTQLATDTSTIAPQTETTNVPRYCTKIGCGERAGPECRNVEEVRPNGPGCEPVCRICRDKPTTTVKPRQRPENLCQWRATQICPGDGRRCKKYRRFICSRG